MRPLDGRVISSYDSAIRGDVGPGSRVFVIAAAWRSRFSSGVGSQRLKPSRRIP